MPLSMGMCNAKAELKVYGNLPVIFYGSVETRPLNASFPKAIYKNAIFPILMATRKFR
jgi:hypothetical protein